jgi:uncharacterized delta-60 repeat protein
MLMNIFSIRWFRRFLLTSIYVLGVLSIVGCSGGGGGSGGWESTSDDTWCDPYADIPLNPCAPPGSSSRKGFNGNVNSIAPALDSSDDVYVGGIFRRYKNSEANRIARLNNDGTLDTSFATGTGFTNTVNIIAPANDGSGDVYVGGSFTSYNGLAVGSGLVRLNNDGSLDTGFSTGSGWGKDGIALANDGSGDVYVARNSSPGIARLNDDGSIDTGFDPGASGFDDEVRSIAVATDGSGDIYAAGWFSDYNGMDTNGLARLNDDGLLDAGFVTDAGFVSWGNFITPAIDGSGDIYVESNVGDVTRLNDDGSVDSGFDSGPIGFNAFPDCVALATDGSGFVYVGGSFTTYNLNPAEHMARLTAGGGFIR